MRIGVFCGSFNPVHKTHELIGLELINNNYLDKIIYVPNSSYYEKEGLIGEVDRYNMLNIMCSKYDDFSVCDFELGKNEFIYTYLTLDYLASKYSDDEIILIMGSDNYLYFDEWYNYEYIINAYKVLVTKRKGISLDIDEEIVEVVDLDTDSLSSTYVRGLLSEMDYVGLNNLLDNEVLDYIKNNKLYEVDNEEDCR